MDSDKIIDWCAVIFFGLLILSIPVMIGFIIYKEIHCWGLDPKTAPIECQKTNTVNVNGID